MTTFKEAFYWIINILNKYEIKYQISGGLAAIAYGYKRSLYDIDIDVNKKDILFLSKLDEIKPYIIFTPKKTIASNFKVYLMTLKYKNQLIDLGESEEIYDLINNVWVKDNTNFNKFEMKNIFNINVCVISLIDLIKYKKIISRKEDLEDLKYIDAP